MSYERCIRFSVRKLKVVYDKETKKIKGLTFARLTFPHHGDYTLGGHSIHHCVATVRQMDKQQISIFASHLKPL